jgi:hypothetical protein
LSDRPELERQLRESASRQPGVRLQERQSVNGRPERGSRERKQRVKKPLERRPSVRRRKKLSARLAVRLAPCEVKLWRRRELKSNTLEVWGFKVGTITIPSLVALAS